MHNGSFDCQFTKQYFGVDLLPALYADTMLMAHTVSENRFNYGLKELSADIFGNDEKAQQTALKEHLKSVNA
jgi:DNA polymerase I-like protein with 3'-5' exonuclease and polymerase domains